MRNKTAPPTVLPTPGGSTGMEVRQLMRSVTQEAPRRVALYPRVSSPKQVRDGYGLPYQEDQMRAFAKAQGYEIVEVVAEPGVSRTEFNRPGLDQLRELAKSGKIDAVLAWKRDRYFGDPGLRAMFEYEMERYGVKLLAMDDSGGDRPEDRFSDGIKDLLAQLEVAKTRERTISGTVQKVREGKVIIGRRVNYGFHANATRDGYEVDEEAARVVRRIFEMIAIDGKSMNGVVNILNHEAVPSPSGRTWNTKTIRTMILDDIYRPHTVEELRALGEAERVLAGLDPEGHYGVWYYGRRQVKTSRDPVTYKVRSKVIHQDRENWLAVPVPYVGVPRNVVEAAKDRIKYNTRTSRASGRVWELDSGVLRCGKCGWRMVPRTTPDRGRPRYYYVCSSYGKQAERCPAVKHYRAEKLEALVATRLTEWFGDIEELEAYIEERLEKERRKLFSGDPDAHARALSERLAKLERMKSNYRRQQAEDVIGMDELKSELAELDRQQRETKTELEKILNRQQHMEDLEQDAAIVLAWYGAHMAYGFDELTPEQRKDAYRRLHLQVTVEPDGSLTIEGQPDLNYLPEYDQVDQQQMLEGIRRRRGEALESLQKSTHDSP